MKHAHEFLGDVSCILLHPKTKVHKTEVRDLGVECPELAKYADTEIAVYIHFTAPFLADFLSDEFDPVPESTLTVKDLRLIGAVTHARAFAAKYDILSCTDTEVEMWAVFAALRTPDWGFNNEGGNVRYEGHQRL